MTIKALLKTKDITVKSGKPGHYAIDCPIDFCKKSRKGQSYDDCLAVDIITEDYAKWKCGCCLWTGHIGDDPAAAPPPQPLPEAKLPETPASDPHELPKEIVEYFEALKIDIEVVKNAAIRWDSERSAISFPYFNKSGGKTNAMLVTLPEQSTRLASTKQINFYGAETIDPAEAIIIVQHEIERLMLYTCGIYNVLALPNGGVLPDIQDLDHFEYFVPMVEAFQKAHKFVLALDPTPHGDYLRHEIVRRVGAAKCFNVKPTRETLAQTFVQLGIDVTCEDINLAVPFPIKGLYEVQDFQDQLMQYFDHGMKAGVSTGWKNVDKFYTVLPGDLTIVTGIPNGGKSEWLDALTMNLAQAEQWKFAVFSPETGREEHVVKLVEKRVGMPADPKSKKRMSHETFYSGVAWVNQHYYFVVCDELSMEGDEQDENAITATVQWILDRARDAVLRFGIKGIIIDPWNEIDQKRNGDSETDYTKKALSKIKRFARNHAVKVWLVAHPKQLEPDRKTGKLPVPSLYQIAGSAHFLNMGDNGIVIHRSDELRYTTEVHFKKVRRKNVGKKGMTTLRYNRETGHYHTPTKDDQVDYSLHTEEDTDEEITTHEA